MLKKINTVLYPRNICMASRNVVDSLYRACIGYDPGRKVSAPHGRCGGSSLLTQQPLQQELRYTQKRIETTNCLSGQFSVSSKACLQLTYTGCFIPNVSSWLDQKSKRARFARHHHRNKGYRCRSLRLVCDTCDTWRKAKLVK